MEREGAEVPALEPKLEARASAYGPEAPMLPEVPNGTPGSNNPKQKTAWERTYKHDLPLSRIEGGAMPKGTTLERGMLPSPIEGEGKCPLCPSDISPARGGNLNITVYLLI